MISRAVYAVGHRSLSTGFGKRPNWEVLFQELATSRDRLEVNSGFGPSKRSKLRFPTQNHNNIQPDFTNPPEPDCVLPLDSTILRFLRSMRILTPIVCALPNTGFVGSGIEKRPNFS
jgi:hypothetical protein